MVRQFSFRYPQKCLNFHSNIKDLKALVIYSVVSNIYSVFSNKQRDKFLGKMQLHFFFIL